MFASMGIDAYFEYTGLRITGNGPEVTDIQLDYWNTFLNGYHSYGFNIGTITASDLPDYERKTYDFYVEDPNASTPDDVTNPTESVFIDQGSHYQMGFAHAYISEGANPTVA